MDCLHFDPPFFAHLGALTGDGELVDLAVEQALAYLALLQDEHGLLWHFWLEKTRGRYGYGWGRGQGWALLGLLDLLRYLPPGHQPSPRLRERLAALAGALAACQRPDGSWSAVVDEPESGPESSTAAFAAAGFADGVARGLLGEEYRERALAACRSAWSTVDEAGFLTGVSAAVWASTQASHYYHVPTGFDVPWGQGSLLVAAKRVTELE